MQTIDLQGLLKNLGLERATDGVKAEPGRRYFSYQFDDHVIAVESTADKVMDALTALPVEFQRDIFKALAAELPCEGDSLVFKENAIESNTAIVTRRVGSADVTSLLVTR